MKGIDNPNDRCILRLLELKEKKTYGDKRRIKKLRKLYPDNGQFNHALTHYLSSRLFVSYPNVEIKLNENGVPDLPDSDIQPYTTDLGVKALRGNIFPSEHKKQLSEKWNTSLSNSSVVIAIIGGILGIFAFFKEQIIRLIDYIFQ